MNNALTTKAPTRAAIIFALLAVYIVWGSTYLAIKFAVATLPPFLMAGVRFFIAGLALYIWARARGAARPTWAQWRSAAIIGAFLLFAGNGVVVWAEQQGVPSSFAALLLSMTPIWMTLINWVRPRGHRPTIITSVGLLLGFAGVAALIGPNIFHGLQGANMLAVFAIPLASLSWAIGSVYSRTAQVPASPLLGTGLEMIAGGLMITVLSFATGEPLHVAWQAITLSSVLAFVYLILFGSIIGFTAYVWLLRNTPLTLASTYAYVNPVVAVFLGWALAGEQLTPMTLVAAGIIVASVCLITTFQHAPPTTQPQPSPALTAPAESLDGMEGAVMEHSPR